ncbi:AAA family ATPase [Bacteroides caecigallinarum]|uniref:AAA family ATPase n=1 Tax=Bacteroides caecigallinarum TaxID=1411144 RepID=UPI00195CCADE|nr:AAA family ATPase [Bacteroides caecigallinarum]
MKYPIGIQSFDQIIERGYVYVDKTNLIYRLVNEGKIYFLSRPRRFGKSLLVSTLKSYFLGRKDLFNGLAISSLETEWTEHPVFHIDFNSTNFAKEVTLEQKINFMLNSWSTQYGLPSQEGKIDLGDRFVEILSGVHKITGQPAVVLIDEYDKPLLDVLDVDKNLEEYNRNILKAFYSVFKAADEHLRFVLLTGVTKFSQVSVFSGFNQPKDISLDTRYEALCGITQDEIDSCFTDAISEMAEEYSCSFEEMRAQLKRQYDGYHFSRKMTDIYNPFSLLNALDSKSLEDYWFRSGTPTYLIRLLNHFNENVNELTGKYYSPSEFIDYKADVERPLPMIFQSGYLTIKGYDMDFNTFLLDFPNNEVKNGFLTLVASSYLTPEEET